MRLKACRYGNDFLGKILAVDRILTTPLGDAFFCVVLVQKLVFKEKRFITNDNGKFYIVLSYRDDHFNTSESEKIMCNNNEHTEVELDDEEKRIINEYLEKMLT